MTKKKVKFVNTGEIVEVDEGGELKDVVRDQGWPIAFGCEDGVCGTCLIHAKEGLDEMQERERQTLEMMGMNDGEHRLACQCKVKGDCEFEGM